jgi:glycosyltransferase involved in cell wall biosynthesis
MATRDRCTILSRALRAWEAQQHPGFEFEVIVVDDGSSDGTAETLESWKPEAYAFQHASEPHSGPGAARNKALRLAQGDIVVFVGDDILPAPDFLLHHWRAHRTTAVPRPAFVGFSAWPPDLEVTTTMRHITEVGCQQFSYGWFEDGAEYDFRHFYTSNLSLPRAVLDLEPSYFVTDIPLGSFEDVELAYRLHLHGMRIFYLASARALHYHHHTVGSFFARQLSAGKMAVLLYRKFPELRKWLRTARVERARLSLLRSGTAVRQAARRTRPRLDELEQRLIDFAGGYDRHYVAPVDSLLREVFEYAYLKGVALGLFGEERALPIAAFMFENTAGPAVRRFARALERAGLTLPRLDGQMLSGHAR